MINRLEGRNCPFAIISLATGLAALTAVKLNILSEADFMSLDYFIIFQLSSHFKTFTVQNTAVIITEIE